MKFELEKNITVMKTLSYIFIASLKLYSDYAKELGIHIPAKAFIAFTLYPVLYIFIYPLFQVVKRNTKKHNEYFFFLNELTLINFVLLGLLFCVLITQKFWYDLGLLLIMLNFLIIVLVSSAIVVFLSLIISWIYVKILKRN